MNHFGDEFEGIFNELEQIIIETQKRLVSEISDDFFNINANLLSKSYLINMCSILESFLKELAKRYSDSISSRINEARLPYNFIYTSVVGEPKEKHLSFKKLNISITEEKIGQSLSPNPFVTKNFFKTLGVNLEEDQNFRDKKEVINSIVVKRNKIVHHNDSANDLTFLDLQHYLKEIKGYLEGLESYLISELNN